MSSVELLDYGDYKGALIKYLSAHPLITGGLPALGLAGCPADRIRGRRPQKEDGDAGPYITFTKVGPWLPGDTPDRRFTGDLWCFGKTALLAADLDRLVQMVLCPLPPGRRDFTAAGCHVYDVQDIGGPTESVEPNIFWPVVIRTYVIGVLPVQVMVTV